MIKVSVIKVVKCEPFPDKTMGDPSDSTFEGRLKYSLFPSGLPDTEGKLSTPTNNKKIVT